MMKGVEKTRACAARAARRLLSTVSGLAFLALGGCREPVAVDPVVELRAASLDSTHIEVGFPESLDPIAMAQPTNYQIEVFDSLGDRERTVAILGATVSDSIRGRAVRIETGSVPDGIFVVVHVQSVYLLTGPTLGEDPLSVGLISGLSYRKDIAPLFARRCNACHSGSSPSGDYSTDSYFSLFGSGTSPDGNLLPGDANSLLVRKCLPSGSMFWEGGLEFIEAEMIRNWVVTYQARQ